MSTDRPKSESESEQTEEERDAELLAKSIDDLAECRGRHKTAMARKSSAARRAQKTSGEHEAVLATNGRLR